jgi:hypothetical protein
MTENTAETTPAFVLPELVAYEDRNGDVRPAIVLAAATEDVPAKLRVIRNSGATYVRYADKNTATGNFVKVFYTPEPDYSGFDAEDTDPEGDEDL